MEGNYIEKQGPQQPVMPGALVKKTAGDDCTLYHNCAVVSTNTLRYETKCTVTIL
jgi:hypothetical protein